jgi:hypothetical protein
MRLRTMRAQTALQREVSDPVQLNALLQDVRAVGLVVTDVHRLSVAPGGEVAGSPVEGRPMPGGTTATYEVRVAGELGSRLLRYLRCSHYVVPEQTTVRLTTDPTALTAFLQTCIEHGAPIERVCRIGLVPDGRRPSPRDAVRQGRAAGRSAPPPPDG